MDDNDRFRNGDLPDSPFGDAELIVDPEPDRTSKRKEFPLRLLPQEIVPFLRAVSESRGMEIGAVASMALTALGSAIGMTRLARDAFADWEEPPILWFLLVSRSGTRKTPVMRDLFRPHDERQRELRDRHEEEARQYERDLGAWKGKKADNVDIPVEPQAEHVLTTDATPEAMANMLVTSPRGVLGKYDEGSAFFGGMGRYSGKSAAERAFWLQSWTGESAKIDRAGKGTTYIPRAACWVVAGVQPDVLREALSLDDFAAGIPARFLMGSVPPRVKQYRQGPREDQREAYDGLVGGLFDFKMDEIQSPLGTRSAPKPIDLDGGARALLEEFVPSWSEEGLSAATAVSAALSKLEAYALRFALILRCSEEVLGRCAPDDPIRRRHLEAGIELVRFFRDSMERIDAELRNGRELAESEDELLRWAEVIRSKGGAVSRREWFRRNTRRTRDQSDAELDALVEAGLAEWQTRETSGRPAEVCAVLDLT